MSRGSAGAHDRSSRCVDVATRVRRTVCPPREGSSSAWFRHPGLRSQGRCPRLHAANQAECERGLTAVVHVVCQRWRPSDGHGRSERRDVVGHHPAARRGDRSACHRRLRKEGGGNQAVCDGAAVTPPSGPSTWVWLAFSLALAGITSVVGYVFKGRSNTRKVVLPQLDIEVLRDNAARRARSSARAPTCP